MEKNQIDELIKELNELSEFEEQNKSRMMDIARTLVDFYMPNRKKHGNDGMWALLKNNREEE